MASHRLNPKTDLFKDMLNETHEVNATSQEEIWQLFFDGASRIGTSGSIVVGVGVVLVFAQNHILPQAFSLTELCSNNLAEYNALLIGIDLSKELEIKHLSAYNDSQLIVKQMIGEYEVRNDDIIPCHKAAIKLAGLFETFCIEHVLHSKNTYVDALASLVANLAQPLGASQCITIASRQLFRPKDVLEVNVAHQSTGQLEPRDWHFLIIDYVLYGILPEDIKE
ncbi:uncharacterized protein LOC109830975 [Asparagus officinalis]|uniref:uncharacterized protein LOC109830975 n=1 Tax=Asparagus officinalis TaxID=4686 RepID=UPI00098E0845|nr:uncharacterized protein LOC109830975 [Asparagus officinalis]